MNFICANWMHQKWDSTYKLYSLRNEIHEQNNTITISVRILKAYALTQSILICVEESKQATENKTKQGTWVKKVHTKWEKNERKKKTFQYNLYNVWSGSVQRTTLVKTNVKIFKLHVI